MAESTEKLEKFFEETKALTFWKRVFGWSQFKALSYDAYQEFKSLLASAERCAKERDAADQNNSLLANDNRHLREKQQQQDVDLSALRERLNFLEHENPRLREENIVFRQTDERRKRDYETNLASLDAIRTEIQEDRERELAERQKIETDRLTQLRQAWESHQTNVREAIREICLRHTITYVESVPFKGSPDNTIKICDEFIIFDAKSPGSDDLTNFPAYIKAQAEAVKKYIREEGVRREVYFVIPTSAAGVIPKWSFNMADYTVYVVTPDGLEPIVTSLKKLEDYEFVDQLSPEERDNICRVVGRFAHLTKRRIQIDQFFDRQSLEILLKCEAELPSDVLEKAADYERAEKLNPPIEKRTKLIPNKALQNDGDQIRREAEAKGIVFPPSMQRDITSLPLYSESEERSLDGKAEEVEAAPQPAK